MYSNGLEKRSGDMFVSVSEIRWISSWINNAQLVCADVRNYFAANIEVARGIHRDKAPPLHHLFSKSTHTFGGTFAEQIMP